MALGVTYPYQSGDFYNSGGAVASSEELNDDATFFLIPGAYWQMWNLGIGFTIDAQFIKLTSAPDPISNEQNTLRLRFTTFHIQAGYGFLDGQLVVGAGLRIIRQRAYVSANFGSDGDLYTTLGLGAEVGVMLRPHYKRWSLGASLFRKMSTGLRNRGNVTETPDGDIVVGDDYLPRETTIPTTGSVGFSYQLGPRPSNPPHSALEAGIDAAVEVQACPEGDSSLEGLPKHWKPADHEKHTSCGRCRCRGLLR